MAAPADAQTHGAGRLHRAAGIDGLRSRDVRGPVRQYGVDGGFGAAIQHQAGRTLLAVGQQIDHAAAEVRIPQLRGGDQQHTGGGLVDACGTAARTARPAALLVAGG